MNTFISPIFIFLNILITLFPIISSQFDDPNLSKIIACMSILHQEIKAEEVDPNIYSAMMLKCYISISESQSRSALSSMEKGQHSLSKSEINRLLDYDSLKDMPQNELKIKSNELEKNLKKFKKMQEDLMGGRDPEESGEYDEYDYEDEFGAERPSNINFFSLIPKGIAGIINVFSSYISLFIIFALVYFFLLAIRKMNDAEKITKKKKKNNYDYDDSDEEYDENNKKSYNKSIKSKHKKEKKN